jgi:serine protease Do
VDGSPWEAEGTVIGVSVTAAPSIDGFSGGWDTPGVYFAATDQVSLTTEELLDLFDFSESCTFDSRSPYEDPLYTGFFDLWIDCDGAGTMVVAVGVEPEDQSFLAIVLVQVVSEADLEALDRIIDSFIVIVE